MGLGISVGRKTYYSHPYSAIHLLREFAAKKEFPEVNKNTLYTFEYSRFPLLIYHSDADGGYVPDNVDIKDIMTEPEEEQLALGLTNPDYNWPSSNALLLELEDLGIYMSEMDDYILELYTELKDAAEASIKYSQPMRFH